MAKIEELSALAPLHNPGAASGIRAFKELLPDITVLLLLIRLPYIYAGSGYRYPVPNRYYTDYQVRKYGAHGTSHQYVSQEAAKLLGKPIEETKIITAHVGNGVSITAVDGGKSVDTSMGLTPLGGVMMGTRTGDLDPAIIPFVIDREPEMA
ncbi:MAG: acetate kinase, partial [Streptococcus salivarius]